MLRLEKPTRWDLAGEFWRYSLGKLSVHGSFGNESRYTNPVAHRIIPVQVGSYHITVSFGYPVVSIWKLAISSTPFSKVFAVELRSNGPFIPFQMASTVIFSNLLSKTSTQTRSHPQALHVSYQDTATHIFHTLRMLRPSVEARPRAGRALLQRSYVPGAFGTISEWRISPSPFWRHHAGG